MEWVVYFLIYISDGGSYSGTERATTVAGCVELALTRQREFQQAQAGREPSVFHVMCIPIDKD
jgi:hypothetical protein